MSSNPMFKWCWPKEQENQTMLLVTGAIFLESLQVLIILCLISALFPVHPSHLEVLNFTRIVPTLKFDRQLDLFRAFVLTNIALAAVFLWGWRARLAQPSWQKKLRAYVGVQAFVVGIEIAAIVIKTADSSAGWASGLLYVSIVLGLAVRIFWPELKEVAGIFLARHYPLVIAASIIAAIMYHYLSVASSALTVTAGRQVLDIGVAFMLYLHVRTRDERWLYPAAVAVGVALSLLAPTGVYLCAAFAAYVGLNAVRGSMRFSPAVKAALVLPLMIKAAAMALHLGAAAALPPEGTQALPMFDCLRAGHFFIFVMALIVPIIYLMTLFLTGRCIYLKEADDEEILAGVIALYGLCLYALYVQYSSAAVFVTVTMPCLALITWWAARKRPAFNKNALLLGGAALAIAIQALCWVAAVVPLYPEQGEREFLFFFLCVLLFIGAAVGLSKIKKLPRLFFITEAVVTVFLLSAWWKLIIYDTRPQLAQAAYQGILVLSVLLKIFGCFLYPFMEAVARSIKAVLPFARMRPWINAVFLLLIVLIVNVPDPQAALAKMFVGEQYHHFDNVVMAPSYASAAGNIIYVDNCSQYGLGLPMMLGYLAKLLDGFSYTSVFVIIMWICIVYYMLLYLLMCRWYQGTVVSMAALLTLLKMQLFYSFSYPMTFTYPNGTVLRSCFDIFFMLAILAHLKTAMPRYLIAAGAVAGWSVFYIFTTGVDMMFGLYAYLALHLISPAYRKFIYRDKRDNLQVAAFFAAPVVFALVFIALGVGHYAGDKTFWHNAFDFPGLYNKGFFRLDYLRGLETRNYWDVLMGCVFPALYIMSMVYIGMRFYLGKAKQGDIFIVVLCVYGLSMYHHYAAMAVGNNYYMRAMPFVFVLFHWVNVLLARLSPTQRQGASAALLGTVIFCLVTNHNFVSHPNVFNVARNPFTDERVARPLPEGRPYYHHQYAFTRQELKLPFNSLGNDDEALIYRSDYFKNDDALKQYWFREFDFSADAALIDRFTKEQEKVALISSFDVKILLQAKRRPYLYFFPFVESRPMRMRVFPHSNLFNKEHLQMTLRQLIEHPPAYIFMERIFLVREVPQLYAKDFEELLPVIGYIQEHYEQVDTGLYLTAMKLKKMP